MNATRLFIRATARATLQGLIGRNPSSFAGRKNLIPALTQVVCLKPTDIKRCFAQGSSANTTTTVSTSDRYAELVKETIKKMISERTNSADEDRKPISEEDLLAQVDRYKSVYAEAALCLKDLREATPGDDDYDEECICAQAAVENAFKAYVDLLEDLRNATEEQLDRYRELRNSQACNLRLLRQELDKLLSLSGHKAAA